MYVNQGDVVGISKIFPSTGRGGGPGGNDDRLGLRSKKAAKHNGVIIKKNPAAVNMVVGVND